MSVIGHCPTCGQHHLAESDTEELHALLTECQRLEREVLGENKRLKQQLQGAVRALDEARLYGEKMIRDRDENVRRCGADLVALIDNERGQSGHPRDPFAITIERGGSEIHRSTGATLEAVRMDVLTDGLPARTPLHVALSLLGQITDQGGTIDCGDGTTITVTVGGR